MDRDYEMAVKVGSEARKNLYVIRLSYSCGGQLHPIGPVLLVASPESGPGIAGGIGHARYSAWAAPSS